MKKHTAKPKAVFKLDRRAFRVVPLRDAESDLRYWRDRSPRERLEALELTRKILYGYGDSHPGLQRVFKVIKLAQS